MKKRYVFGPKTYNPHAPAYLFKVRGPQPQRRADGSFATMENCGARECRWPYGDPARNMVMCGRKAECAPYCKEHQVMAHDRPRGPQ